ncbi:5-(carboxyamino)imidazole ribonucleotide synthase [Pararhizobium haloflavum]|uniref:5-(carboxyamino)imidazole ribonucleotide synthase n=1 Tax=Pararhizobium haloflavum TaxID=2037914 RepID=UPI000C1819DD|nr:5-(carboxyamino)imidazole ribonucleotide synthase [Pararhizobium haloflavum]
MSGEVVAPGSIIGIIGGGQLARMLAMAAARLGYRTVVLEPQPDCPAAQVANRQIVGAYDDPQALEQLASACHIVTYEFENVAVGGIVHLARSMPVYPPPGALEVSQDRLDEKRFLQDAGLATADYRSVDSQNELEDALEAFQGQGVLKTRRLGYDGKGQVLFRGGEAIDGVYDSLGAVPLILEALVSFDREISVIAARDRNGTVRTYDPAENVHRNGILATSTVPARVSLAVRNEAARQAAAVLDALDYVGVAGIEFFVLADGRLVANEMAPRVHNSGHWTEAACLVSQFENHVRAVCGLPLGSTIRHSDCVMHNIIGEEIEGATDIAAHPDTMLHLYGKAQWRSGRKMGHYTTLTGRAGND